MINFLDAKDPPTFPKVLKRMSEDARCLLTGSTENLTYFPVDTNPQNFLPSNMSCISDDIAKKISYTFFYDLELWGYTLTLDSPADFVEYNQSVIHIIRQTRLKDCEQFLPVAHNHFVGLFEYLTKAHLKGIAKIAYDKTWLDSSQYQGYILRALATEKASAPPPSKIISPNLGIVKP